MNWRPMRKLPHDCPFLEAFSAKCKNKFHAKDYVRKSGLFCSYRDSSKCPYLNQSHISFKDATQSLIQSPEHISDKNTTSKSTTKSSLHGK